MGIETTGNSYVKRRTIIFKIKVGKCEGIVLGVSAPGKGYV